jgi:hypothetical protein
MNLIPIPNLRNKVPSKTKSLTAFWSMSKLRNLKIKRKTFKLKKEKKELKICSGRITFWRTILLPITLGEIISLSSQTSPLLGVSTQTGSLIDSFSTCVNY